MAILRLAYKTCSVIEVWSAFPLMQLKESCSQSKLETEAQKEPREKNIKSEVKAGKIKQNKIKQKHKT